MDKKCMNKQDCTCAEKNADPNCTACGTGMPLPYWCETCKRQVPEKRCPGCGLKCHKFRKSDRIGFTRRVAD